MKTKIRTHYRCIILFISLFAVVVAQATPPVVPANWFIRAEPTDKNYQLRVTWRDFADEDMYRLVKTTSSDPGPIFVSPEDGSSIGYEIGKDWEIVNPSLHTDSLAANTTELVVNTLYSLRFGIIAYKGWEATSLGVSEVAEPTWPADVLSVQISNIGADRFRVQWIQTDNTVYSRVSLDARPAIENDPDQSVLFTGLSPNTTYTIRVCVRGPNQTASDESCVIKTVKTAVLAPLGIRGVEVNQDDPNPYGRRVSITCDNRQANAVLGVAARLIKDDQLVQEKIFQPQEFGTIKLTWDIAGLDPFQAYEVWASAYNVADVGPSVGPAAGVEFTTPAEVVINQAAGISGDAIRLGWQADAVGEYGIEANSGAGWVSSGSVRVTQPGPQRVVVQNLNRPVLFRLTWRLAYLHSVSTTARIATLAAGTPEMLSVKRLSSVLTSSQYEAYFRPTVSGVGSYVVQKRSLSGIGKPGQWVTVVTTPLLAFHQANSAYRVTFEAEGPLGGLLEFRACLATYDIHGQNALLGSEPSRTGTGDLLHLAWKATP